MGFPPNNIKKQLQLIHFSGIGCELILINIPLFNIEDLKIRIVFLDKLIQYGFRGYT